MNINGYLGKDKNADFLQNIKQSFVSIYYRSEYHGFLAKNNNELSRILDLFAKNYGYKHWVDIRMKDDADYIFFKKIKCEDYEFTTYNGEPVNEEIYEILKHNPDGFGFCALDTELDPDRFFDNALGLLTECCAEEGTICILKDCADNSEISFAIDTDSYIINVSEMALMGLYENVYFKLKER